MAIFNFGPATITHNSVDLGKTVGGGSLSLDVHSYVKLRTKEKVDIVYGGSGQLNLFSWDTNIQLTGDITLLNYAKTVITCTDMIITLYNNKFTINSAIMFGTYEQRPFTLDFSFMADDSSFARIIDITNV